MRWSAALFAAALLGGCEQSFEPFLESDVAIFSMFGHLDLYADTQWVRVTPVRRDVLVPPEPLDAVVTLERVRDGRTVTLRDSLFAFPDPGLGSVAYAHNFWTTERLEPGAEYRLTATRPDGLSTVARVVLPEDVRFTLHNDVRANDGTPGLLVVHAPTLLWVDLLYVVMFRTGDGREVSEGVVVVPEPRRLRTGVPGLHSVPVRSDSLNRVDALNRPELEDLGRRELRITVGSAGWPYHPALSDVEIGVPGSVTSNVENGLGFVGGVGVRTIPYHRCQELAPRPGPRLACEIAYDLGSPSLAGTVLGRPCVPRNGLANVRLTERFPGGGAIIRHWRAAPDGRYRFDGIEPGAELTLDLGPGTPQLRVPPLARGQRYLVPELTLPGACR